MPRPETTHRKSYNGSPQTGSHLLRAQTTLHYLANIFMSHFEDKALNKYDGNLPLFYKRYVDDTFVVFNDREDCELFFEYFNTQHKNIKFTLEHEQSDCISFLDVLVSRNEEGTIETSLYRKKTFSGLYMKFDSFVPQHFKKNLRWFGMLKNLTGGYFATSICIFPLFCILLFPNNTKINWIC